MNSSRTVGDGRSRERLIWTAAVAALLTTTTWLAMVAIALATRELGVVLTRVAIVGRVLLDAIVTFAPELLGVGAAAVAATMLVGLLLPRAEASQPAREGMRHG